MLDKMCRSRSKRCSFCFKLAPQYVYFLSFFYYWSHEQYISNHSVCRVAGYVSSHAGHGLGDGVPHQYNISTLQDHIQVTHGGGCSTLCLLCTQVGTRCNDCVEIVLNSSSSLSYYHFYVRSMYYNICSTVKHFFPRQSLLVDIIPQSEMKLN